MSILERLNLGNRVLINPPRKSDTTSLATFITNYRVENGRRYHAFDSLQYYQPNDEIAQEHLDICHALCLKTFDNRSHLAPLSPGIQMALDIGTGTGIWAIDFADEFPAAQVIGTDLSPIQPSWVPPNCKFVIDDAEGEWDYPENSVDYIHVRSLFGSLKDWPRFYAQCMRVLKPGGYIEQLEFAPGFTSEDGTVTPETTMGEWGSWGLKVFAIMERDVLVYQKMAGWMRDAGFEDVVEQPVKWPIGPWPKDKKLKEIGLWCRAHLDIGLENWSLRGLTGILGWTVDEVTVYCAKMRQDLRDKKLHGIHEMAVAYARKPAP